MLDTKWKHKHRNNFVIVCKTVFLVRTGEHTHTHFYLFSFDYLSLTVRFGSIRLIHLSGIWFFFYTLYSVTMKLRIRKYVQSSLHTIPKSLVHLFIVFFHSLWPGDFVCWRDAYRRKHHAIAFVCLIQFIPFTIFSHINTDRNCLSKH